MANDCIPAYAFFVEMNFLIRLFDFPVLAFTHSLKRNDSDLVLDVSLSFRSLTRRSFSALMNAMASFLEEVDVDRHELITKFPLSFSSI